MPKGVIIVVVIAVAVVLAGLFLRTEEPREEPRDIVEKWIVNNAPTYVFDGFDLELISEEELVEGKMYFFVFSFESRAAGYGDRTDQMVAQVITPHIIEIVADEGRVISAVTDGAYDEIKEE